MINISIGGDRVHICLFSSFCLFSSVRTPHRILCIIITIVLFPPYLFTMVHTTVRNPLFTVASIDNGSSSSSSPNSFAAKVYPLLATGQTNLLIGGGGNNNSEEANEEMYALLTTIRIIKPSMKLPYRLRLGSLLPSLLSIMCGAVTASTPTWGTSFSTFFNQKMGIEFYPFQLCSYGTYGDDDDPPLGCTTISPHLVFKSDPKYTLYGTGIVACMLIPLTLLSFISLFCFPRIFISPIPTIFTALPLVGHIICVAIAFQFRYTFLASNNPNAAVPNLGVYSACIGIFCSLLSLILVSFAEHQCYTGCHRICCRCCGCPVPKINDDDDDADEGNYDNKEDQNSNDGEENTRDRKNNNRRKLSYTTTGTTSSERNNNNNPTKENNSNFITIGSSVSVNSSINSTNIATGDTGQSKSLSSEEEEEEDGRENMSLQRMKNPTFSSTVPSLSSPSSLPSRNERTEKMMNIMNSKKKTNNNTVMEVPDYS